MNLATLVVRMTLNNAQFASKLASSERHLESFGKGTAQVGKALTRGVTVPMLALGGIAVKTAVDFDRAMANVNSLGGETSKYMDQWRRDVQKTAIELGKTTGDLTNGLYQVVSAFGASSQSSQILAINAKAAAAGLSTTTDAINLTSAVTKAYGDTSAAAVQHVADLALRTVQLGQTTFPELAASIGRVTPLASTMGVKMEELFAILATATGVTGDAAEVNTQMRSALTALMNPSKELAQAMADMGYSSGRAMIQELGFVGALQKIAAYAKQNDQPLSKYIRRVEGVTLALALSGGLADDFAKKMAEMRDVSGTLDEAFNAQTQGVNKAGFKMAQLRTELQVLAETAGEQLLPALVDFIPAITPLIKDITKLLEKFNSLDDGTKQTALRLLGVAAATGPVLNVLGTGVTVVSEAAGLFSSLGGVIEFVGPAIGSLGGLLAGAASGFGELVTGALAAVGPVGWVILAIIALVAGLYLAWKHNFLGIRDVLNSFGRWVLGVLNTALVAAQQLIALAGMTFQNLWNTITSSVTNIGQTLSAWWTRIKSDAAAKFHQTVAAIRNAFHIDWAGIGRSIVHGIINGIGSMAGALWNKMKSLAAGALDAAKGVLGIHSPSSVFEQIGVNSVLGYIRGVTRMSGAVVDSVRTSLAPRAVPAVARQGLGGAATAQSAPTQNVTIHIYNPERERASDSIAKAARRLAHVGAVPVGGV